MNKLAFSFAVALFLGCTFTSEAQEKKTVKIDVTVNQNGETKRIQKEVAVPTGSDISDVLSKVEGLENIEIDGNGEDIRILIQRNGERQEMHFSMDDIERHLELMMPNGAMSWADDRAFLGVTPADKPHEKGAEISGVTKGSAAEKAGLASGDVIYEINGIKIANFSALSEAIQGFKPGDEATIKYYRNSKKQTAKVTMGKRDFQFATVTMGDKGQGLHRMELERSSRPFLGITFEKNNEKGVQLLSVLPGTSAEAMGLQKGDVVIKMDGKSIATMEDVRLALDAKSIGDVLKVEVERAGKSLKLQGELKKREGEANTFAFAYPEEFRKDFRVEINIKSITDEDREVLGKSLGMDFGKELTPDEFKIAPNPSSGKFTLSFALPNKGKVAVRVVNSSGQVVYEEELNNFSGNYERKIDISSQPRGLYYLVVSQNDKPFTKKLMVN